MYLWSVLPVNLLELRKVMQTSGGTNDGAWDWKYCDLIIRNPAVDSEFMEPDIWP